MTKVRTELPGKRQVDAQTEPPSKRSDGGSGGNGDDRVATQSISDVERDTGVAKETLRVWERRYQFPKPARDALGQRTYRAEDIDKLRLVKRLIDLGHRPGKILGLPIEALQALELPKPALTHAVADDERAAQLQNCLALCSSHRSDDLRYRLSEIMLQSGLQEFVIDFLAPLNIMVGEAWAAGKIAVHEEHLYTESVQVVMRNAIATIPSRREEQDTAPRVLLTTLPQERHGLGLLMVEALASLGGAVCISLGVQTPVGDIVQAAALHRADILALSFSLSMRPKQVTDGLTELRARLPASVEIWAGGSASVLNKFPSQEVRVLGLHDIGSALGAWRERRDRHA
ncbi:MAG TPA: MerR family transcriptional regulator [Burkholderiaceae bacterium]